MKIWIDVLTPKQANLFGVLKNRLEGEGFEIALTTREYREVNQLLELRGVDAAVVGRYGGPRLIEKLTWSAKRIVQLAKFVSKANADLALSFSSPEAARVAFGLSIPHYCVSDSPHAEAVSRLTVPLSRKLFTPRIIPREAWTKFGISKRNLVQYDALDPVAWIRRLRADGDRLRKMGLEVGKPIVTFRLEEAFAAYLLDRALDNRPFCIPILRELLQMGCDAQLVALPRYGRQASILKREFGRRVFVPKSVVDGFSLLSHTSVFIGAGGTMTAESALMGVPSISCFPSEATYVEKYLIQLHLLERMTRPRQVALRTIAILGDEEIRRSYRRRAIDAVRKMEDPIEAIVDGIKRID